MDFVARDGLQGLEQQAVQPFGLQQCAQVQGAPLLLGSETQKLLAHSRIPVLVYR